MHATAFHASQDGLATGNALEEVRKRLPAPSSFANMPAFEDDSDDDSSVHSLPGHMRSVTLESGRQHSSNSALADIAGITKAK